MKRFLSFFCFLFVTVAVIADSCYQENRNKGLRLMTSKQYDKAMKCFFAAKSCTDKPKNNDIDKLISRCVEKKKEAEKEPAHTQEQPRPNRPTPTPEPSRPREPEPPRPLTVNKSTNNFAVTAAPLGEVVTYEVAAPGKYSVSSNQEWCIVKEQTPGSFSMEFLTNPKPRERSAAIEVVSENDRITIEIDQEANIPQWTATGSVRSISSPAAETPVLMQYMRSHPKCRLGALTTNRRGVIITGNSDAIFTEDTPEGLKLLLERLRASNARVDAIALTGSDYYCVIWDDNKWDGNVPVAMKEKLNEYIGKGAKILDISISDDGNFTILSDSNVYASRKSDMDLIIAAEDDYGLSQDIQITPHGICIVCEYGIVYRNIPENMADALNALSFRPEDVTFTDGGTYIITSQSGDSEYNLR